MKTGWCIAACRGGLLLLTLLAGCADQTTHNDGMALLAQGKSEEGLAKLEQASRENPENIEYRVHYLNAKEKIIAHLMQNAQQETSAGHFDAAESLYRKVLQLDSGNSQGEIGLSALGQARRDADLLAEANTLVAANQLEAAQRKVAMVLEEDPRNAEARDLLRRLDEKSGSNRLETSTLSATFRKPVTLEFRDAALKQVLEALSRHSGLNFVLDKDVPPNIMVTVFLRQVSVEEALDVMLSTNQLRKRVLNDTTLLIYPDTTAKQSELEELQVRTFYLANANAKEVMNMLKTVLKARNVYVDEKLNLLIMRDTPETIDLAEKLVATQDISEPEVMLEVEVVEVERTKMLDLGIQPPDQLTLTPLPSNGTNVTLRDLEHLKAGTTGAVISPLVINLQDQLNDSNILANPRIRTHNKEKAEIKIGDRVPVITSTATSTGFVSNSVQYIDVGLKLGVEPTIYSDDQVSIKLELEVSSLLNQITASDGTVAYEISTRNASTVLRLKDGETQILGGLISDNDTRGTNRLPGLSDFPVLGRLFSNRSDSSDKTELVLSITPHLVRGLDPPPQVPSKFWSGTEASPRMRPLALASADSGGGAADIVTAPPVLPNALPAATPQAVALHWTGPALTRVGDHFKLTLDVSSASAIKAFPLQIKYDSDVLEALDAEPANFMAQGNVKAEVTKRIEGESGSIFISQDRGNAAAATGQGDLLELEFRALKPAQNTPVTVLPTTPLGTDGQGVGQTEAVVTGITVTP